MTISKAMKDILSPVHSRCEETYSPLQLLNEQERYSWIKAPRWRGNAINVRASGPTSIALPRQRGALIHE